MPARTHACMLACMSSKPLIKTLHAAQQGNARVHVHPPALFAAECWVGHDLERAVVYGDAGGKCSMECWLNKGAGKPRETCGAFAGCRWSHWHTTAVQHYAVSGCIHGCAVSCGATATDVLVQLWCCACVWLSPHHSLEKNEGVGTMLGLSRKA
eukprot:365443-Chlamydomonas_euryale.AAC.15